MTETLGIRESVLSYTTTRPRSAERIFGLVRAEWGEIGERRLWRILNWLVGRGAIVRVGQRHCSDGYVLGRKVSLVTVQRCGVCGGKRHNRQTCENLETRAVAR